jgi:hypothetical protein
MSGTGPQLRRARSGRGAGRPVRVTSPGGHVAAGDLPAGPEVRGYDASAEDRLRVTGRIPLTLRIGVSGHRLIGDPRDAQRKAADAVLWLARELHLGRVSERSPVCLQVVTPLAAGADQIVADAVTDLGIAGTTLIVPAVSDEASYVRSIAKDNPAAAEYYQELRRNAAVTTLAGTTADDAGFRKLGEWVVNHCDILVALWDGEPPKSPGPDGVPSPGTAAIVSYALSHAREIPVIVVPVARADASGRSGPPVPPAQLLLRTEHTNPFLGLWLLLPGGRGTEPQGLSPKLPGEFELLADPGQDGQGTRRQDAREQEFRRSVRSWEHDGDGGRALRRSVVGVAVRNVRRFNARPGRKPDRSFSALIRQALPSDTRAAASPTAAGDAGVLEAARNVEDWASTRYLRADVLARNLQRWFRAVDQSVYVAAAVSVLLAAVRTIWTAPGSAAAEFLTLLDVSILAGVSAVLIGDVRGRLRDQWLSFRGMAEYLRMHMFLAIIYPRTSVETPSMTPLALNEFVGPAWFGSGTLALWWHRPATQRQWSDADVPLLKGVLLGWIRNQHGYHEARGKQHAGLHRKFLFAVASLFVITVLAALTHVFATGTRTDDALNLVAVGVPGVAAAVSSIATSAEHHRLSVRHRSSMYQLTSRYLPAITGVATFKELCASADILGGFMLSEATDWYAVLAAHTDEIPA